MYMSGDDGTTSSAVWVRVHPSVQKMNLKITRAYDLAIQNLIKRLMESFNKCVFSLQHSSSLIFEASRRLASGDKTQEHQHHFRWRCNKAAVDNLPSANGLDTKHHI